LGHQENVLDVISNLKKENIITLAIEQVERCSLLQVCQLKTLNTL
jgi:hypothetical protein